MRLVSANDYQQLSQLAADFILEKVKQAEKLTLGLATGSTPIGTYQLIIEDYQHNKTSYSHVTTFNLDEYVGIKPTDPNSYHYFMEQKLFKHLPITSEQIHIPNGLAVDLEEECRLYESRIKAHEGIDLQLLGIGSNGHIGFNEPGTTVNSRTHIVNLTEETRRSNARFFEALSEVPTQAITMGLGTIMDSKEILLLVSGKSKSKALFDLLEKKPDPSLPASILDSHPNVTIIADQDALQYVK
ncbi:glucosamine-6-phosphate deaminase [Aquibacillus kalidii]|uniref:glucosamine-6-phosphate deaminase n=1 Tax=Aquibacillus kalidii TaxID=2762597 RepID=UPI0016454074|nr:glucosamine-6-phosphate deaminase [Aquibacillus kalidii]